MPRIEELYAYVTYEPGDPDDEGLAAMTIPGIGSVPMIGADMARMKSLKPLVQVAAKATGRAIRLVKFSNTTVLETMKPE